jgi:putative acetyltransferase
MTGMQREPSEDANGEGDLLVVRPETPADREAIASVVAAAFRSQREADLVDDIRASADYIPELSLVAVERVTGEIVGHVMVSHTDLDDGETRHQILHLAPLAVAPSHQRQGIGSSLVYEVLAAAKAHGAPFVVLQGDPRYYGRFGFEPSTRHGISLDLPDWAVPEAAQIIVLRDYDPALRGRVVYPPAFDEV